MTLLYWNITFYSLVNGHCKLINSEHTNRKLTVIFFKTCIDGQNTEDYHTAVWIKKTKIRNLINELLFKYSFVNILNSETKNVFVVSFSFKFNKCLKDLSSFFITFNFIISGQHHDLTFNNKNKTRIKLFNNLHDYTWWKCERPPQVATKPNSGHVWSKVDK